MTAKERVESDWLALTLPIELTNGNDGRTKHFGQAAKRRRKYETIIRTIAAAVPVTTTVKTPVKLVITRILGRGQRLMDADSLGRGNAKELIDAIVAAGLLPDDGPRFVVSCEYRQDEYRRLEGPAVRVDIETVKP